jgi:membrane protease YdiL (CAAX protease family)
VRILAWGLALVLGVAGAPMGVGLVLRRVAAAQSGPALLLHIAIACACGLAAYTALVRWGERRPVTELAPARALPELAIGLAGGAALFSVVILLLVALGGYTLTAPRPAIPWQGISLSLSSAVIEELLFRAILFRLVWGAMGLGWALGISSVVFGLLHLLNPPPDPMGALSLIVEAGLLLAAAYVVTQRLFVSIGGHFGWNFTQGYVFGAHVSGTDFGPSIMRADAVRGASTWLTGGHFGPEASAPAVIAGLLAALALLAWRPARD